MQASLERLRQRREEGREGGFTLIELLIVIVILAILAAIVVFAVQNLTGQSAKAACQSDYKTAEVALETYKAQVGSYPATLSLLNGTQSVGGTVEGPWLKDKLAAAAAANGHYWFTYSVGGANGYSLGVSSTGHTDSTGNDAAIACTNVA